MEVGMLSGMFSDMAVERQSLVGDETLSRRDKSGIFVVA